MPIPTANDIAKEFVNATFLAMNRHIAAEPPPIPQPIRGVIRWQSPLFMPRTALPPTPQPQRGTIALAQGKPRATLGKRTQNGLSPERARSRSGGHSRAIAGWNPSIVVSSFTSEIGRLRHQSACLIDIATTPMICPRRSRPVAAQRVCVGHSQGSAGLRLLRPVGALEYKTTHATRRR